MTRKKTGQAAADGKPRTPGEALLGRRGYAHDPLEGASGTGAGERAEDGAVETRQQSDPAADRD